jgi:hypothetical protein
MKIPLTTSSRRSPIYSHVTGELLYAIGAIGARAYIHVIDFPSWLPGRQVANVDVDVVLLPTKLCMYGCSFLFASRVPALCLSACTRTATVNLVIYLIWLCAYPPNPIASNPDTHACVNRSQHLIFTPLSHYIYARIDTSSCFQSAQPTNYDNPQTLMSFVP